MSQTGLDGLDNAAVHVLRRLLRGETVPALPFHRAELLRESSDQLTRRGLVVERAGKTPVFVITAAGKALAPDIKARDAEIAAATHNRAAAEAADRKLRDAAPALLKALQDLIEACIDPAFDIGTDEAFETALAAQGRALDAAVTAIASATTTDTRDRRSLSDNSPPQAQPA